MQNARAIYYHTLILWRMSCYNDDHFVCSTTSVFSAWVILEPYDLSLQSTWIKLSQLCVFIIKLLQGNVSEGHVTRFVDLRPKVLMEWKLYMNSICGVHIYYWPLGKQFINSGFLLNTCFWKIVTHLGIRNCTITLFS